MRQRWRDLLFLHFSCDPSEIASLLPPGLTVDTFPDETGKERAWIGLVPFLMNDVRWAFMPRIPGTHTFPETNVRTYVHYEGRDPGVWFFSLDAANVLAVKTARMAFALPYFAAQMKVDRRDDHISYRGIRARESYEIESSIGKALPIAAPGALEFFLAERYLLYAYRHGRLLTGRVHHSPYEFREAGYEREDETLVQSAGISPRPFIHRLFSEGVDVDVFPLRPLS